MSSWNNLLVAKHHNFVQSIDENKENIQNLRNNGEIKMLTTDEEAIKEDNRLWSTNSSISEKPVSEGWTKPIPDSQINPLKKFIDSSKIAIIHGNKQNKKIVKRIKQNNIKRNSKEHAGINFGTKVANSVKNAGTSRVSYNKIFYANKSKSSLKNYNNALKACLPKK